MAQITTQVILPSGICYEHNWSDTDTLGNYRPLPTDDKILKALSENKRLFGYNGTVRKRDASTNLPVLIDHGDPASGFIYDRPETIVAIVECEGLPGEPDRTSREVRRLKGPPVPAIPPATAPTPTTPPPTSDPVI